MFISITFNSFKNLSFRSLPINKEYIYSNLGYDLMQKLQSLKMTYNKHVKSISIKPVYEINVDFLKETNCNHRSMEFLQVTSHEGLISLGGH